jgi:hypothetical protein
MSHADEQQMPQHVCCWRNVLQLSKMQPVSALEKEGQHRLEKSGACVNKPSSLKNREGIDRNQAQLNSAR